MNSHYIKLSHRVVYKYSKIAYETVGRTKNMTTYLSTITTQHTWNEKKYSRADLLVTCTNPDDRSDLVKESFKKCLFFTFAKFI